MFHNSKQNSRKQENSSSRWERSSTLASNHQGCFPCDPTAAGVLQLPSVSTFCGSAGYRPVFHCLIPSASLQQSANPDHVLPRTHLCPTCTTLVRLCGEPDYQFISATQLRSLFLVLLLTQPQISTSQYRSPHHLLWTRIRYRNKHLTQLLLPERTKKGLSVCYKMSWNNMETYLKTILDTKSFNSF